MNLLADMLAGIVDRRLDGAACTGRWDLFDLRDDNEPRHEHRERVTEAQHICARCPILDACYDTATRLSKYHRSGVWAGTYYDAQGRPRAMTKRSKES